MKRVRTWLVALSFLAAAAGWEPPPRSPEGGDKKSPTPATGKRLGRPDMAGVVKAVSADGKTLSVTTQVGEKAGEEESTDLTLTDETRVVFTSVGPGGAGVRKGYFIRAWLAGGKGPATRIHLASTTAAANDAPSLAGVVTAVGEGGRSFAILIAEKTKEDKEEQAILKITAKTGVRFTHVAAGGARLKKGMRAVVWLADGSKEDIERVILYGSAEKFDKDRTTEPAFSGKVALAEEGKSLTVEVPAAKKGEKARRVEIRLGDMTEQVYRNVPEDGAKPKPEKARCAYDIKRCADGSFVGRSGPSCEFVCPEPASK